MLIRSPIVAVLGHVDHGKTTLLDTIRKTFVVKKEAGGITQMIGASYVKKEQIEDIAKDIRHLMKVDMKVPGVLFIDTPGHEAFSSLRERGGSIADIAILVIDINEGFKPQTTESIRILKRAKTPFIVAANKIDLLPNWKEKKTYSFIQALSEQAENVQTDLDTKLYELVGQLSEEGFDSERFDRVKDFRTTVAIVPISAKTGVGLAELLLLLAGLSQKFMEKRLQLHPHAPAKGTVMEVRFEKGLGHAVEAIVYDGVLKEGDTALFCTKEGPKPWRIRAILEKGAKGKYKRLKQVVAAVGVKLVLKDAEEILSGSPFACFSNHEELEQLKKELVKEIKSVLFTSDKAGVLVKADSIGSIEAILKMLREAKIAVKSADTGAVSKKDVMEMKAVRECERLLGVIFAFNVDVPEEVMHLAEKEDVKIIQSNIIYRLLEEYEKWVKEEQVKERAKAAELLPFPCKLRVLPGCLFRHSKPVIFGIRIECGVLKPGAKLMNERGEILGEVKQIQLNRQPLEKAEKGQEVAISCQGFTADDIREDEVLYVAITKEELNQWDKFAGICLSSEERELLKEIHRIWLPKF